MPNMVNLHRTLLLLLSVFFPFPHPKVGRTNPSPLRVALSIVSTSKAWRLDPTRGSRAGGKQSNATSSHMHTTTRTALCPGDHPWRGQNQTTQQCRSWCVCGKLPRANTSIENHGNRRNKVQTGALFFFFLLSPFFRSDSHRISEHAVYNAQGPSSPQTRQKCFLCLCAG